MSTEVFDTVLHADVVEAHGEEIAVGCYELEAEEGPGRRKGCVWLLDSELLRPCGKWEHGSGGVLDLRWMHGGTMLVLGCADGALRVISRADISEVGSCNVSEGLVLSVDVSEDDLETLCSCADGSIHLVDTERLETKWDKEGGHSYEAWIASFETNRGMILSGGDDGALRVWDAREDPAGGAQISNVRAHSHLGVISAVSDPLDPMAIMTGGYDDHVRFWDLRKPLEESHTAVPLEGGPWRIKVHPTDPTRILVPAMYAGAYLLSRSTAETPQIVSFYREHTSIVYGACWPATTARAEHAERAERAERAVTCSFYDHSLHAWDPQSKRVEKSPSYRSEQSDQDEG